MAALALEKSTKASSSIVSLPDDIVTEIVFEFLNVKSILNLRLVSHFFKDMVDLAYWSKKRPFRLNLQESFDAHKEMYNTTYHVGPKARSASDLDALGRLFHNANIKRCEFFLRNSYATLMDGAIYSEIEEFRVCSFLSDEQLPAWLIPRIHEIVVKDDMSSNLDMFATVEKLSASTCLCSLKLDLTRSYPEDFWMSLRAIMERLEVFELGLKSMFLFPLVLFAGTCAKRLKKLSLANKMTLREDVDLDLLLCDAAFPGLESLSINGINTNHMFSSIRTLKIMKLSGVSGLTDLSGWPNLESLDLNACWTLISVADCPCLKHLTIQNCVQLERIVNMPSLIKATLKHQSCCEKLVAFTGLPNLCELYFHHHRVYYAGFILSALSDVYENLRVVEFDFFGVDYYDQKGQMINKCTQLALRMPNVQVLSLSGIDHFDEMDSWCWLRLLGKLKELDLRFCGYIILPELCALERLTLDCTFLEQIPPLAFPKLLHLELMMTMIQSENFKVLWRRQEHVPKLVSFRLNLQYLGGEHIHTRSIISSCVSRYLEYLDLADCMFSQYRPILRHCRKLRRLHVNIGTVDEMEEFEIFFAHLENSLERLEIRGNSAFHIVRNKCASLCRFPKLTFTCLTVRGHTEKERSAMVVDLAAGEDMVMQVDVRFGETSIIVRKKYD